MKTIRHVLEFCVFQFASFAVNLLPLDKVRKLGRWLGGLAYGSFGFRKSVIRDNLMRAFPDLSPEGREEIALNSFRSVATSLVELLAFPRMTEHSITKMVRMDHPEVLDEAVRRGKGVVLLTAHVGNWELIPLTIRIQKNIPVHSLYKTQSNPWIDRKIYDRRTAFGAQMVSMGMGVREILRILQSGACVLIAADQSAPKESIRMSFFGREVPVFQGPAVFCLKTGAMMIGAFCLREPDGSYVLKLRAIASDDLAHGSYDDHAVKELTRRHMAETEQVIREHPDQWMWMHRRWKHSEGHP